jgi:hypothetical protein
MPGTGVTHQTKKTVAMSQIVWCLSTTTVAGTWQGGWQGVLQPGLFPGPSALTLPF